ncbi:MAG: single-stranded DNA-binding protein [Defluviitaleaceae bacterium]|nr:single-stranded DNA-binding protein [Defluviitaleaceae bacterium]
MILNNSKETKKNVITLSGTISGKVTSNFVNNEEIYTFQIKSERTTGKLDLINVHLQKKLTIDINPLWKQMPIGIIGEIRTCPNTSEIIVFANELSLYHMKNAVKLIGTISKEPLIKQTYRGKIISEFEVEVVDTSKKVSYFIPVVGFHNIIAMADNIKLRTLVEIQGRLESRVIHINKDDIDLHEVLHDVATDSLRIIDNSHKKEDKDNEQR